MSAAIARAFAVLLACTAASAPLQAEVPSFAQVRADWRSSDAQLLDRHGELLQTLRIDRQVRRLQWVSLQDVSPAFRDALLRSEDRRFLEHGGIDWQAVGAALAGGVGDAVSRTIGTGGASEGHRAGATDRKPRPLRGASTITMQLAGLLEQTPRSGRRSWPQKFDQALAALAIERAWTKDQILEAYLNLVGFRGELQGLAALTELLFGKDARALDAGEGALAAALIRAPNATPDKVARRACLQLQEAGQAQLCDGLAVRAQLAFARREPVSPLAPSLAPHLARRLLTEAGEQLYSTLDARVQRLARETLMRHVRELAARNVHDGAVVVLDNATGEVLAWVGSTGSLSEAAQVDAVLSPRQAGSTLKPFLYAQAIAERRLTAASLLADSPLDLPAGGGLYGPRNYDGDYKGTVSVRTALASSLNVPAVRAGVMVTPIAFAQTLQRLGLATVDRGGDHYGFSLALGSADVTLLELTNAYRALANGGVVTPVRTVSATGDAQGRMHGTGDGPTRAAHATATRTTGAATPARAIDPAAAFIVADILADRNARALTFGWDSPLALPFRAAVKTGTSKDMRDNWCIGFSRRFTVGVWVGNAAGEPMWDVSGVSGAAPVWAGIMRALHGGAGEPTRTEPPPPGVVRTAVRFAGGIEPARSEWFVAGTEQSLVTAASESARPAIVAPVDRTIVALDPDIPPSSQRLRLAAEGVDDSVRWMLEGREIARGRDASWFPLPGRHELALQDRGGNVVDRVRVEVRGALLRAGPRPMAGPARGGPALQLRGASSPPAAAPSAR